ncbi:MAG: hypothetical protein KDA84_23865, partial [Planctomycetaceae bacterium]|nr:hypothetical protein [Planctomycetaceae bacterium]
PLHDARHFNRLVALYARHAADVDLVALALRDHKHVMIRLQEVGLPGAEAVFFYPRTGKAAAEYGRWVDDLLGRAVRRDEDDLIAALGIVLSQGTEIRRRMEDDPQFRQRFDDHIWPRFERLVERGHLTWEQAAWDNHLFDLLALPEGEALVTRWGMLPSYVLFGPDSYPAALHPRIIAAMQAGDNGTLEALLRFGRRESFRNLLDRKGLSNRTLTAALGQLQQVSDVNIPAKLEFFASLSDDALAEEVGPPPSGPVTWLPLYDSYEVTKKLIQGRPVSGMDWAFAITDPALMFFGPAKAGSKGTKILTTTLRNNARKQATKQLGRHTVKLSEKELSPWVFSQALRHVRQQTGNVLKKKLTLEITGPVRYFYRATGVGRKTFKKFSTLEARLFMRADGKVLVRFDRLLSHPALEKFFKETAEAALHQAVPGARQADLLLTAWRRNASAWWFVNAVDLAR